MNPSLESAAAPSSAVPITPTPSLARKIMKISSCLPSFLSSRFLDGIGLFTRAARVHPNADILILAGHLYQVHISDIFKSPERGCDVQLVLAGLGNQSLRDIPGNRHFDVLLAFLIYRVHHHESVLFGHANIVARILHTHKLAFRGSLESLENGSYVHVVGVEVSNADLAVA